MSVSRNRRRRFPVPKRSDGAFGTSPGTLLPSYGRFDAFVEKKIDKNWTMNLYEQNSPISSTMARFIPTRRRSSQSSRGRRSTSSRLPSSNVKQLPPGGEVARALCSRVLSALSANPKFISAAIPLQIFPPLFNRYAASGGHHFGLHVDNAATGDQLTGLRIRADLSVTLFLSEYDGGELVWRTFTVPMKSNSQPGTSCFILLLVCIWSRRSPEVCGWRLFSGCRAWYGMRMPGA